MTPYSAMNPKLMRGHGLDDQTRNREASRQEDSWPPTLNVCCEEFVGIPASLLLLGLPV